MAITKVYEEEVSLWDFNAWSGGEDGKKEIIEKNLVEEFENYVNDIYPDGCSDVALNDLLWFDRDNFYEYCGLVKNNDGEYVTEEELEAENEDEDEDEDEENE